MGVASRGEAWIETFRLAEGGISNAVASRGEAWIETRAPCLPKEAESVASRGEAWIETFAFSSLMISFVKSPPVGRRGLKLRSFWLLLLTPASPPVGRRGLKPVPHSSSTENGSRLPWGGVD